MSQEVTIQPGEYADLMPDMSDEEFEALKRSLKQDGLKHPIEIDENGIIVDGHHRFKACQEVGVEPETVVVETPTVEAAIRSNFTRRNLNDGTKRKVVESYLETHWDDEMTQKAVAEALGVSEFTVSKAMEKVRPKDFTREEKREQAAQYIGENPEASNRKVADAIEADVSHATIGNWRSQWEDEDTSKPEPDDTPELDTTAMDKADERVEEARENAREVLKKPDPDPDTESQAPAEKPPVTGGEQEGEGSASEQVLRRQITDRISRIDELEAAIREFIRCVENQDVEGINDATERAKELVE